MRWASRFTRVDLKTLLWCAGASAALVSEDEDDEGDDEGDDGGLYALFSYTAADADELSFEKGDIFDDVVEHIPGWVVATIRGTGERGMVPSNYLEEL